MPNILKLILLGLFFGLVLALVFKKQIEVAGIVDEAPTIVATINPKPNENGWNNTDVIVSFACDDMLSGIATCTAPVTLTADGHDQVVSGVAIDHAGNTKNIEITVRIDKDPPHIDLVWPPVIPLFLTDLDRIEIAGSNSDDLSGIARAVLIDFWGTTTLALQEFSLERRVRIDSATDFALEVTDLAGNLIRSEFVVAYKGGEGSFFLPTNPAETQNVNGIVTSYDRALVRFEPTVDRSQVEQISRAHGGRVSGFMSGSNIAQVIFESESVTDLEALLVLLSANSDVATAHPVVFFEPQQVYDNAALSAAQRAAYDSVKLSEAVTKFTGQSLDRVGVAIIDSGLDSTFGQFNEFRDIDFYDLCTSTGQNGATSTPSDDTGHGTKLIGIIAGANNASGNNGMVRGIPGSQFRVKVFKTNCDATMPGSDVALVMQALNMITTNVVSGIDVVNLSLGLGSDQTSAKIQLADYWVPFFRSSVGNEILWVASAGNNDDESTCSGFLMFPAGLACTETNVVSVGAYDPANDGRAPLSNFGSALTLSAPGAGIYTAVAPDTYGTTGGTSSATAMVSGAAALLLADVSQSPAQVRSALESTARPLADPALSQGGLDVDALLGSATPTPFPPLARSTLTGQSTGGLVSSGVNPPFTMPGLAGFKFDFDNGDLPIAKVYAGFSQEVPGVVLLRNFSDGNAGDAYSWTIDRQELPPGTTFNKYGKGPTSCNRTWVLEPAGADSTVPVLTQFTLEAFGDYQMDLIHVRISRAPFGPLVLEIAFQGPTGANCSFTGTYALVPVDRVASSGDLEGLSDGGTSFAILDADQPILQGFRLDFYNPGNNEYRPLDKIGVRLMPGEANVTYSDSNADDDFRWKIWWVDVQ
jgi:hypothetical protein